jgi:hypothetical protein
MATAMQSIKIDEEFKGLLFPLTEDERAELESSLLSEGCRDALVTWNGLLLDGHNRYDICTANDLEFDTTEADLPDRDAAKAWIIRNQLARRNLSDFQRGELSLKLKSYIADKAKSNLKTSTGGTTPRPLTNSTKAAPVNTRAEVAKLAGVSEDTVRKVEEIQEKAIEPVKQMARSGGVSVNAAHVVSSLSKAEQAQVAAKGPEAVKEKAKEIREAKQTNGRLHKQEDDTPAYEDESQEEDESFGLDIESEPKPDPKNNPDKWAERWTKFWSNLNLFLVSLPRRGGIVNLTKKWPRKRIDAAVVNLKELRATVDKCIAELEETYK